MITTQRRRPGQPGTAVPPGPCPGDAANWHSAIAERFDGRYQRSASFRERLRVWEDLIGRHATPAGDTLDAGCGSGRLTMIAARCSRAVVAFDASPAMVRLARLNLAEGAEGGRVEIRELQMAQLGSLADRSFALVIASSVLEYVDDFWAAVVSLASRLAPGGTLIFSVPNMASLYRQAERGAYRLTGRPRYMGFVRSQLDTRTIRAGLADRGLTVAEVAYYAPAPVLSWLARPLGLVHRADNLIAFVCRCETGRPCMASRDEGVE